MTGTFFQHEGMKGHEEIEPGFRTLDTDLANGQRPTANSRSASEPESVTFARIDH
ncbi:MAG: hypothetical protein R2784_20550 [Saprospiraceae bacterium]